eukprot:5700290-Amphidinium_carterae.3
MQAGAKCRGMLLRLLWIFSRWPRNCASLLLCKLAMHVIDLGAIHGLDRALNFRKTTHPAYQQQHKLFTR